jgi:hypothetical protein
MHADRKRTKSHLLEVMIVQSVRPEMIADYLYLRRPRGAPTSDGAPSMNTAAQCDLVRLATEGKLHLVSIVDVQQRVLTFH